MRLRHVVFLAVTLALAAAFATEHAARAQNPERVFGGQILLSKKRFPTSARSKGAYVAQLRRQRTKVFWENEAKEEYKIYFAAFFKKPLNDLEVTISIYDVTDRQDRLVTSFEQFLDRRGQTSIVSNLTLTREQFGVNRRLLMTMENRGRRLAIARFQIRGKAEQYSGKVDFSDEIPDDEGDDDDDDGDGSGAPALPPEDEPPEPEDPLDDVSAYEGPLDECESNDECIRGKVCSKPNSGPRKCVDKGSSGDPGGCCGGNRPRVPVVSMLVVGAVIFPWRRRRRQD